MSGRATTGRVWIFLGSISALAAVAAGAFGAHSLKEKLSAGDLLIFETAARYAMYHALALLCVGLLELRAPSRALRIAGFAFLLGTALFSGSLFALVLSGARWLGAVTPFGGAAFLLGWAALAAGALRPAQSAPASPGSGSS